MKNITKHFHSSAVNHNLPNHPLYPQVDWTKVAAGHYAIVLADSPEVILYFTQAEFTKIIVTWKSNASVYLIIATPGSTKTENGD
jgi:roadblock/LC7 domain-containing protein